MIVFGGGSYFFIGGTTIYGDVWALSLSGTPAWTQLSPFGSGPSLAGHSAVYDPVRDRMLVFGGGDLPYGPFNDTWALTLTGSPAWIKLAPTGTPPPAMTYFAMSYDPHRDRVLVSDGTDCWSLTLAGTPNWTKLAPTGGRPPALPCTGAFDIPRDRFVTFRGTEGRGEAWALWSGDTPFVLGVAEPPTTSPVTGLQAPTPNPTHGTTTLSFTLARTGHVAMDIYDVDGRHVRTLFEGDRTAGSGRVAWDGSDAAGLPEKPGVYFVRLVTPGVATTCKLVLLR
jgi:hypothetical protein